MKMLRYLLFCGVWGWAAPLLSQERVITAGFQFKPIYSARFFGTGPQEFGANGFNYRLTQGWGYSGGMNVRKGINKTMSFETGINYVVRNFNLSSSFQGNPVNDRFKIVGYEIPLSMLVFIRVGERQYINASAGLCLNMFPSDVAKRNSEFSLLGARQLIFNPSLLANVGFEWRTEKSGYFYTGTSLNRPFVPIYQVLVDHLSNNVVLNSSNTFLSGIYLTLDFRYFFHEDPQRRQSRKSKAAIKKK